MTNPNPDYHSPITVKEANSYYIFPKDREEARQWRQWFKMIDTKMKRYQNRYHIIKSYYQSNC